MGQHTLGGNNMAFSWAAVWTAIGTEIFKKGVSGLAGGGEQGGGYQYTPPSFGHLKVDIDKSSEAGEVGEIETADVIDIAALQTRLFNPPYQKTEIVIPPIMRV
jgi:hypothetical protein